MIHIQNNKNIYFMFLFKFCVFIVTNYEKKTIFQNEKKLSENECATFEKTQVYTFTHINCKCICAHIYLFIYL